jgi:hypothetical protein
MTEWRITERRVWRGINFLRFERKGKLVELICDFGCFIWVAEMISVHLSAWSSVIEA